MGSDSYKAWNDWMDSADNHVYSLFDIWEAGRDFQRESDAKEIEKLNMPESRQHAFIVRENK